MGQAGASVLSIAGTLVGSYFGGPVGGAIGGMAGGLIGSAIFGRTKRPLITDTQMANSTYGNPLPLLFGTARLPGIMIWQTEIQTKSTGGLFKGGASNPYSYHQSAAVAFCAGPAHFVKIWFDGKLLFDTTATAPHEMATHKFAIRTYSGTADQLPDFLMVQWVKDFVVDGQAAPAYRDLCYMVFDGIDLVNYGGRFPQVTASWSTNAVETTQFFTLGRLNPDVSSNHGLGGFLQSGLAVDWIRGQAYLLSSDGSIRVFDLSRATCILAATQATMFRSEAVIVEELAAGRSPPTGFIGGLVCSQGSDIYTFSGITDVPHNRIWWIDPTDLNIKKEMLVTDGHGIIGISGVSDPAAGFIWGLQAYTVATAKGSSDYLVGSYLLNSDYSVFLVDPQLGTTWSIGLTYRGGASVNTRIAIGPSDPVTGETEIWFCNFSVSDTTVSMYVSSIKVLGIGVTFTRATVVLNEVTFGQPPINPLLSGGALLGLQINVDPVDNCLIFTGLPYPAAPTAKWNYTSGLTVWTSSFIRGGGGGDPATNCNLLQGILAGGTFTSGPGVPLLNTATGAITYSPIGAADSTRNGNGVGGIHYNGNTNALLYWDVTSGLSLAYLQRTTSSEVSVAAILAALCAEVGVTADMIDVSAVTATTVGYVVRDNKACGAAIADLCHVYQIDMVESDYKLKFVPRGQAVVATLTQADLGSIDAKDASQYWAATIAQEQEMPLQVNTKYSDPDLDFQPGSAYARRTALPVPTVFSKRKLTVDLPVIVTNAEAQVIAQNWLYTLWAERDTYQTVLSPKFLWLDPTDNIVVDFDDGSTTTVRIESIETGADLALKLALASEDLTVYTPATTTGVTYGIGAQSIAAPGFGDLLQINVPLLQDGDAAAGLTRIYYAVAASNAGWRGGLVYRSTDGANWPQFGTLPSAANYGHAVTTLGDTVAKFSTDLVNTVTVTFATGATLPSSCAYADLMMGANAALLGQEIIQFQTVTDNPDGSLTLSTLIRSRRGTEWATGTHGAGELCLLLQPGLVVGNALTPGEIGVAESWQLVPVGSSQAQAVIKSFAYTGDDLKPYAPVNFKRAPAGSDLAVTWVRRTRIGGGLIDGSDTAPLNEDTEAYSAYVLPNAAALAAFDPTNVTTYTRAFTGLTTATLTYTAAQMTSDGFVPATATLYLVVYQLSGTVGRGFRGYQALPAF